jgi:hypothetical protein
MMDEQEDRLDARLRDAAQDYNAPPPTPKAEIWARVSAQRAEPRTHEVLPLRPATRPTIRLLLAIAALLLLGIAVGRFTAPGQPTVPAAPATASGSLRAAPGQSERGELAEQLTTVQHLGQAESFLTEFNTRAAAQDLAPQARELLSSTRLLLDSKRLTDPRTRKLLEDLELVLVQIATLDPKDRREDLDLIADGLAQNHLRTRLRNAIPSDPTIRM